MGMISRSNGHLSTQRRSVQRRGQSGRRSAAAAPMSEINVTPLVDVMLVLLVIFMLTAPLLTVGVPVDLPKSKASPLTDPGEPITLSLTKEGDLFLQDTKIDVQKLVPKVKAVLKAKPETQIYIRGDQGIAYGKIMEVMGVLISGGFHKIALLSEAPTPSKKKP